MAVRRLVALALVAGTGSVALAQVSAPDRIRIAPVGKQQQTANTAGGAGRVDARIDELQAQIDALAKQVSAQANAIQGLKSQIAANGAAGNNGLNGLTQRVSAVEGKLGGLAGKGELAALRTEFVNHKHWGFYEKDELGKNRIKGIVTSCPLDHLVENPGATSAREQYSCSGK